MAKRKVIRGDRLLSRAPMPEIRAFAAGPEILGPNEVVYRQDSGALVMFFKPDTSRATVLEVISEALGLTRGAA